MFGFFRRFTENRDKKVLPNLAAAFAVGIALMVGGNVFFGQREAGNIHPHDEAAVPASPLPSPAVLSYEQQLERRLESLFEAVEGAGRVQVMLTFAHSREIVVAEDSTRQSSTSRETDAQGGTREQASENLQENTLIFPGQGGTSQPLILKEIMPRVEGVIIVAQGGDNIHVRDALIRATQTVLGVEPHKVHVLRMRD